MWDICASTARNNLGNPPSNNVRNNNVGERAFAAWLESQKGDAGEADGNAVQIVDLLWPLVEEGRLAIPRGGYLLRRGRGRIIVEPARS